MPSMRAVVQNRYGSPDSVLQIREVDIPQVGDDEVLVRVRAASVHPDVWHAVTGRPRLMRLFGSGVGRPNRVIPGTDVAGEVEAVGAKVTRFRPGDAVFGETMRGQQWVNGGSFAEYVAAPESALAPKPDNVSFEQAASVATAGLIVLNNLDLDALTPDHHVLVNGAAGNVGSVAVQLARSRGARVTGVDRGDKLDLVRSLGADATVDYEREDFTARGERYDIIFDVASNLSFLRCRHLLTATGHYVRIGHDHYGAVGSATFGSLPRFFGLLALTPFVKGLPRVNFSLPEKHVSLARLHALMAAGQLVPVVDRAFPLGEVVEAMRVMQAGTARGRLVLTP